MKVGMEWNGMEKSTRLTQGCPEKGVKHTLVALGVYQLILWLVIST